MQDNESSPNQWSDFTVNPDQITQNPSIRYEISKIVDHRVDKAEI